jgi:hypothetical protein
VKRSWGILVSASGCSLHLTPRRWVAIQSANTSARRRSIRVAHRRPVKPLFSRPETQSVPLYGLPVLRGFVEPTWVDLDAEIPAERFLIDVSMRGIGGFGEEAAPKTENKPETQPPKGARQT